MRLLVGQGEWAPSAQILEMKFKRLLTRFPQVSARGNVNRFYKCVKLATLFGRPRFARYEFQEMTGETVDETKEPISEKRYWGNSEVFSAYNTDYLAEGIEKSQQVFFEAFDLTFGDKVQAFKNLFSRLKARK